MSNDTILYFAAPTIIGNKKKSTKAAKSSSGNKYLRK